MRADLLETSSNHLQLNLLYFNLLILVLSAFGSYFFARRTMRPIEEMVEAQNRFTADASHELRTPLAAMRTEIEVALRDKSFTVSNAKKLLESNIEEITKLESLSGALLKLARYESTKEKLEEVNLSDVIIEAYQKVESLVKKKKIVFENEIKELKAKADKQSLVELFVILLDNAIKYSEEGKKICITMSSESNKSVIRIKDEGVGIKASELPHIFERFYRADISRVKTKVDGYGLGLSLAKQIADLNVAEISVKSTPGKGSEFTVKLPA